MSFVMSDRVVETTTTTGTGAITLAGAKTTFRDFDSVMANLDQTFYCIQHQTANEWEVGVGTWNTGNTLSRTTIIASSNAGSVVTLSGGTKDIFMTPTLSTATPSIVSVGSSFTSTGTPTATLPGTHAQDDILVLCIQTSNQTFAAPSGYTQLGPRNGNHVAAVTAGATRLCVFWKRDNGSESAPTLSDSGDHTFGVMFAVRGCPTTGDPFRMIGQYQQQGFSTGLTGSAGITASPNNRVITIYAHGIDSASAQASTPVNSTLTSVNEDFDGGTADGTGGGIVVISGIKATPGDINATTAAIASTASVSTTFAAIPMSAYEASRPTETEYFYGTPADLDDIWTKPFGARRVHAQIVDGGGGGSGGNTTTTAAGGGGGGGGGYDDAWFDADDLGATVTLHPGTGGAAGTALNQAGNAGTLSVFETGAVTPLSSRRIAGVAATAAASADGGNGGSGSGRGAASPAVATTRVDLTAATAGSALGGVGGRGGSGTTAPTGGSPAERGGGGGNSGADTDAAILAGNAGWSGFGGGGGGGGRTNANVDEGGHGGGASGTGGAQGSAGADSARLPYGGAGGRGGGSSTVTGGPGGFPGGGGGGGAGVAGGFGGRGGHGLVMVTTYF